MPVGHYPFIDIAVHDSIRERFARGEALALFSTGLDEVIWANGGGARLFGHHSIYEFMDRGPGNQPAALRQLRSAAARVLASGAEQAVLMRPGSGFRRGAVQVRLSPVALSGGVRAILLAGDTPAAEALHERASRIIDGLAEAGTHVAVLDGAGEMLAASPSTADLAVEAEQRRALVDEVAGEDDRLVKRLIDTGRGSVPAAIARLTDDPVLHLLFAVETNVAEPDADAASGSETSAASPAETRVPPRFPGVNAWRLSSADSAVPADEPFQPQPDAEAAEVEDGQSSNAATADPDGDGHRGQAPADQAAADATGFTFDPTARAVRFVWKMDAESRFSDISADFAETVGPNAADVIGRHFRDVARVFGLDRDGTIASLLQHRDTWSGRTVMWPVQGAALSVPVDLAALPTYTRDREFSGFRGFGIVRVGDASKDSEAIGLSLAGQPAEQETGHPSSKPDAEPAADRDTAEGETPAGQAERGEPLAPKEAGGGDENGADEPDPFRGEVPALSIADTPGRRESDKVIHLEEHRPRSREGLSTGEQAAFREIGKRLSSTFGRREPDAAAPEAPNEDQPATALPEESAARSEHNAASSADDVTAGSNGSDAGEQPPAADEEQGKPERRPGPAIEMPSAFALPRHLARRGMLDEQVIDQLPVALLVHSGETVHHANPDLLAMTGYDDVEALREAGGLAALFAAPQYADGDSGPLPGTMTLIRADGTEQPVHARLQSIAWREGRALMLSLVPAREETETASDADLKAEEEAARLTALTVEVEELRSILETATDGVVILGEQGEIRSLNGSASALFDYDDAELRGQPFVKLFAHESQRAVMDYLHGLAEHGVASVLNDGREVIGREASGGFLPLFMTIGRLSGSKGYCAVMRDITQWKRTEEELRSAKRAAEAASSHKSEFLARVSHEIRTPLNAIIGFSDMMAEQRFGPIGSPRYLEYAHDIGRSGKHVLDIVNDLLDISKIEAGEMEVAFTAVALNDTIADAVSLLQPQANSQRVIIRTSLSSSVPEIVADERSIRQIALNLLSNAVRFTPPGGQIVVSTAYETSGSVALRIRDTGIGMTRSELEQAMKPFRQVAGGVRRRGDGTGLGLPLTKAMVEANRAQFDIRSSPGEGTLVEIVFPPQRVLAD